MDDVDNLLEKAINALSPPRNDYKIDKLDLVH